MVQLVVCTNGWFLFPPPCVLDLQGRPIYFPFKPLRRLKHQVAGACPALVIS